MDKPWPLSIKPGEYDLGNDLYLVRFKRPRIGRPGIVGHLPATTFWQVEDEDGAVVQLPKIPGYWKTFRAAMTDLKVWHGKGKG